TGARPIRRAVEPAALGVRTTRPLARAAHVDDVRVALANLVDVDAQSLPHVREVVGDDDVGGLDEPVEQLAPLVGGDVEPDGNVPAVGDLEHEVDDVAARNETR